ncbi:hypothetical protein [Duganella levis]|uniref:Uncharacterized protein n=1 Tax=Duganella levis TaxID=2692169 RepID=A0ABW9VT51_9BURK|nr:hypothetical protein [Duganella levis]MYN24812.1 hypothetical protein [Duganella levis]
MRRIQNQRLGVFAEIGLCLGMLLPLTGQALRLLAWLFNAAVRLGAWIITACIKVSLAILGMVIFGGFIFGVGYVIFYPMFSH